MVIVIDANIIIELEKGNQKIADRLKYLYDQNKETPTLTSAIYAEVLFGYVDNIKKPIKELNSFRILDFDKSSAEIFAKTKKELERKGKMIPLFDLITASCAISNNATLVTVDKHFKNVPGLKKIIL